MDRGITLEIDLNRLRANLDYIKNRTGQRKLIAVVKADAYGHGAAEVARLFEEEGVRLFGVAYTSEAIELRESGITSPIIVFFDTDIDSDIVKYSLTPLINSPRTARELSRLSRKTKRTIPVHINIDTGMGRMGIRHEVFQKEMERILALPGIRVTGIMSHFSDADLSDRSVATAQLERFKLALSVLRKKGLKLLSHMANSAAVINLPETYLDAVRPGILLYGVNPCNAGYDNPVMTAKTRIIEIRRLRKGTPVSYGRTFITQRSSLVGLIPCGYADGIIRAISNHGYVLVKGRKAQIIGRVCMDLTMVDLTGMEDVGIGDEVVLMGRQDEAEIRAQDIAGWAGTISYEILTTFGNTGRRVYLS